MHKPFRTIVKPHSCRTHSKNTPKRNLSGTESIQRFQPSTHGRGRYRENHNHHLYWPLRIGNHALRTLESPMDLIKFIFVYIDNISVMPGDHAENLQHIKYTRDTDTEAERMQIWPRIGRFWGHAINAKRYIPTRREYRPSQNITTRKRWSNSSSFWGIKNLR